MASQGENKNKQTKPDEKSSADSDTTQQQNITDGKGKDAEDAELDAILDSALADFEKPPPEVKSAEPTKPAANQEGACPDPPLDFEDGLPKDMNYDALSDEMNKQFEETFSALLNDPNLKKQFEGLAESAEQASADQNPNAFAETMAQALSSLNLNAENIQQGEPNQQELFEQLGATFDPSMAGGPQGMMGGMGGMDAMGGMFQNMVRHLLSKELLYEPLKEVSEKYTVYIAKEAATLSAEDIERYKSQQGIVDQVVTHLDGDSADLSEEEKSARFEVLLDLLQKSFLQMHELGQPPTEVVGEGQSVMPDFSSVMGMGQAPMAVIKMSGMSEDMQQDAVDCATQALEKYNCEEPADIAARNSTKSTTPPGK